MDKNKTIGGLVFILLIIFLSMVFEVCVKNNCLHQQSLSPNILNHTQPITSFSGRIEKVEDNTFYVTGSSGKNNKQITFKITTDKNTTINNPYIFVPYLIKSDFQPTPQPITLNNLSVGQQAAFTADKDLRTLESYEFQAVSVNPSAIHTVISGTIKNIQNNILTVLGGPLADPDINPLTPSPMQKYSIEVDQDTEISRLTSPTHVKDVPAIIQFEKTDLTKNMRVVIYTDVNVKKNTTFKALRIEPGI
ncbi:MAG: hypothetical protein WC489_05095 [Patescibacteria group bacterium]